MNSIRFTLALLGVALALVLTACGGGQNVPAGAIAVVNGTDISRTELDGWITQAKKSYKAQKQQFPKVGTPEYQNIQTEYVAYLVQRAEFEQAADDLGIKVTEKDIDKGVSDYIKSKFGGKRKDFERALKAQDFPEETFRQTIRLSVLSQKIFDAETKDVTVAQPDLLSYYNANISNYSVPEAREVQTILIAKKASGGAVDYAKSKAEADRIYGLLKNGADFTSLVAQYTDDTQAKQSDGKLTIHHGETVPEFDKAAFSLKKGVISQPIKSTYGYHVLRVLKITPGKTTPFGKVQDAIRASLLQQKKQDVMTKWVEDLNKKYKSKVSYATGFEPPQIPTTTSTETQTQ
jgi:parvulin-like peptidyl-prolyl isomerase